MRMRLGGDEAQQRRVIHFLGGILGAACWLLSSFVPAQEILPDGTAAALRDMQSFKLPTGMQIKLFAAEPQLASPVAICLDEKNRVYVAEEYRFNRGTEENRTRPFVLTDDLQIRTLDDRMRVMRKFADKFDGGMDWFTRTSDQVRLLEDRDGDGRADRATLFADKFNAPLDGLAAGLIARDGNLYFTCIPHLWLLKDNDGDGVAEHREPLLTGFGVNFGFLGHDLHGLVWGPDGKLYFSVGDRGFHVTSKEGRTTSLPRRGAVFRCDPDGSNFEVIHIGLRNPQELAFDEFGHLFAADNNCDKGDHSRLVYVVAGADSGWNMSYQTMPAPYLTGPWHAEKIWHVEAPDQPAWVLPPVGKLGAGPSGFVYYPGTGLSERYQQHFFLCNYSGKGGVEAFAIKPKGARFEITDPHEFFKGLNATDADFGYDGKFYVSDFVNLDWSGKSLGGRIYVLSDPQAVDSRPVRQMQQLMLDGVKSKPTERLLELFSHPDLRVRLRAQFEVASRGADSLTLLKRQAVSLESLPPEPADSSREAADIVARRRFARHWIWALGQLARTQPTAVELLRPLLSHAQRDVREQATKVLGEHRDFVSLPAFVQGLRDDRPTVRFESAMALARLPRQATAVPVVDSLFDLLRANAEADPYLRHAGVLALTNWADAEALQARTRSSEFSERLAVLLVGRRQIEALQARVAAASADQVPKSEFDSALNSVAAFLSDADPRLVLEAARVINDLQLDAGLPLLVKLSERVQLEAASVAEPLARRVIHANFRAGTATCAANLMSLLTAPQLPAHLKDEVLACLNEWEAPSQRDRVTGIWRPLAPHSVDVLKSVLEQQTPNLLSRTSGTLQAGVVKLIAKHSIKVDDRQIAGWAADEQQAVGTRLESLKLLAARQSQSVDELVDLFLKSGSPLLRATAREVLAQKNASRALESIVTALTQRQMTIAEAQAAIGTLATMKDSSADAHLQRALAALIANRPDDSPFGYLGRAVELDLLEAAGRRPTNELQKLAEAHRRQAQADAADGLARFSPSLLGGDADRGASIYRSHPQAQCIRCHKIRGDGGDAGPDLTEVAKRGDRRYLLESLVDPHAKIAKGFGVESLILKDGQVISGVVQTETAQELTLKPAIGPSRFIAIRDIEERSPPKSAMPGVRDTLPLRDIRDLVEFLSTLK